MRPFYESPPLSERDKVLEPHNSIAATDNQLSQQAANYYSPNRLANFNPPPTGPVGPVPMVAYNAYASLLNKASLNLTGAIEEMTLNWTEEEKETKRRLVQFWRQHENNVIHCGFQPVAPAERGPNSIVVSCIYWEEKNDYFITSVDCIYLLESLIAVRFTVEEKNRIRRNLEGFRPLTVSKCKPESAEFFKLIMSFPNPKPRNIEKDVKVFPWKVLPYALKKIIGKYTASYSSTVSVNMDTFNGAYSPNSQYNQQGYNPQFNRPRFYSQDLGSMANQTLASAGNPGTLGFSQSPGNVTESGQDSPQLTSSMSMQPGYNAPSLGSHHPAPQRRHLYLRRHSLADPYTMPYNQPRRHSLADINLRQQQQQQQQQQVRGFPADMYSPGVEQYPTAQLLLSGGLNTGTQGQHPFSRDSKAGILGGNYGMGDNSGSINEGYGENNPTQSYEGGDEYSRNGRGSRFAPMATINQAQEMNYANFSQDPVFGQRGAVEGFQSGMQGAMDNSSLPPNTVGVMPMMSNPSIDHSFPSQESSFMMGSSQTGEYQQH